MITDGDIKIAFIMARLDRLSFEQVGGGGLSKEKPPSWERALNHNQTGMPTQSNSHVFKLVFFRVSN